MSQIVTTQHGQMGKGRVFWDLALEVPLLSNCTHCMQHAAWSLKSVPSLQGHQLTSVERLPAKGD